MKKVACVIIFWLDGILVDRGCSRDAKEDAGEEVLVNLNISVALSDVAQSMARGVEEDAGAERGTREDAKIAGDRSAGE